MSSPLLQLEPTNHFPFAARSTSANLLKQFSATLAGVTPASRLEIRPAPDTASSGIARIDALTGGLPRGCLTEVCGPESSGRICTLIDASDSFDPHSAMAAGVNLDCLLWVRCGAHVQSSALSRKRHPASSLEEWKRRRMEDPVEQALRATDLLLQSSGFGMVAIDLASVPLKMARRIPLTTWFRFRRAVENTPTILLVIGTHPCAESCASLALKLSHQPSVASRYSSVASRQEVLSCPITRKEIGGMEERPSHAELLTGIEIRAEVLRSRSERKPVQPVSAFRTRAAWTA
ncbi:MAG: hypothetical protein DMG81_15650 [Acidobacteria bacterium]|nr:MAG: hypothetical protein DMG81_15650 [Acidobacteriota bacterium]